MGYSQATKERGSSVDFGDREDFDFGNESEFDGEGLVDANEAYDEGFESLSGSEEEIEQVDPLESVIEQFGGEPEEWNAESTIESGQYLIDGELVGDPAGIDKKGAEDLIEKGDEKVTAQNIEMIDSLERTGKWVNEFTMEGKTWVMVAHLDERRQVIYDNFSYIEQEEPKEDARQEAESEEQADPERGLIEAPDDVAPEEEGEPLVLDLTAEIEERAEVIQVLEQEGYDVLESAPPVDAELSKLESDDFGGQEVFEVVPTKQAEFPVATQESGASEEIIELGITQEASSESVSPPMGEVQEPVLVSSSLIPDFKEGAAVDASRIAEPDESMSELITPVSSEQVPLPLSTRTELAEPRPFEHVAIEATEFVSDSEEAAMSSGHALQLESALPEEVELDVTEAAAKDVAVDMRAAMTEEPVLVRDSLGREQEPAVTHDEVPPVATVEAQSDESEGGGVAGEQERAEPVVLSDSSVLGEQRASAFREAVADVQSAVTAGNSSIRSISIADARSEIRINEHSAIDVPEVSVTQSSESTSADVDARASASETVSLDEPVTAPIFVQRPESAKPIVEIADTVVGGAVDFLHERIFEPLMGGEIAGSVNEERVREMQSPTEAEERELRQYDLLARVGVPLSTSILRSVDTARRRWGTAGLVDSTFDTKPKATLRFEDRASGIALERAA